MRTMPMLYNFWLIEKASSENAVKSNEFRCNGRSLCTVFSAVLRSKSWSNFQPALDCYVTDVEVATFLPYMLASLAMSGMEA